jgi:hypothetical protein
MKAGSWAQNTSAGEVSPSVAMVVARSPVPPYRTSTSMPVSAVKASITGWTKFSLRPEYRTRDSAAVVVEVSVVGMVVVLEPSSEEHPATRASTASRAVIRRILGCLSERAGDKIITTSAVVQKDSLRLSVRTA